MRFICALAVASTIVLAYPAPVSSEAGGAEHHLFNPAAQIDRSQIEVWGRYTK